MLTILSSPKGGTGTSVVAASLAIVSSSSTPTLLVDLAGDQAAILGLPQPPIGLSDWANGMTYREFDEIVSLCHDNLYLAPTGTFDFETLNANAWTNSCALFLSSIQRGATSSLISVEQIFHYLCKRSSTIAIWLSDLVTWLFVARSI